MRQTQKRLLQSWASVVAASRGLVTDPAISRRNSAQDADAALGGWDARLFQKSSRKATIEQHAACSQHAHLKRAQVPATPRRPPHLELLAPRHHLYQPRNEPGCSNATVCESEKSGCATGVGSTISGASEVPTCDHVRRGAFLSDGAAGGPGITSAPLFQILAYRYAFYTKSVGSYQGLGILV